MARIQVKLWSRRDMPYCAKLVVEPEDEQEEKVLRALKEHAGVPQTHRRLDVVYRWRKRVEGP